MRQARRDIDKCYDQARNAAVEIKETAVTTYYNVRGTMEEILAYIKGLFNCFGTLAEWAALGYSYEVVKNKMSLNIGMSTGDMSNFQADIHGNIGAEGVPDLPTAPDMTSLRSAMTDDEFYELIMALVQFKMANLGRWVSLDLGVGIGVANTWLWSGVGISASLSCWIGCAAEMSSLGASDANIRATCDGSCTIGLSVGAILSAWVEMYTCPAYALLASKRDKVTCTRSYGVTFLTMCRLAPCD